MKILLSYPLLFSSFFGHASAAYAAHLTERSQKRIVKREIKKAIKQGYGYVYVPFYLEVSVAKYFERLGYDIYDGKIDNQAYPEARVQIIWR